MKKMAVCASLLTTLVPALAQEIAQVLSSTPIVQAVPVVRPVCTVQAVAVSQPATGAGAVFGSVAGGLIGSALGNGSAGATMAGVIGGALVGNQLEQTSPSKVRHVQQCVNQTFNETHTVGWNVVYEYQGQTYSVQMPYSPGPTVRLQRSTGVSSLPPAPASGEANAMPVLPAGTQSSGFSQTDLGRALSANPVVSMPSDAQPLIDSQQPLGASADTPAIWVSAPTVLPVMVDYGWPAGAYYAPAPYFFPAGVALGLSWGNRSAYRVRQGDRRVYRGAPVYRPVAVRPGRHAAPGNAGGHRGGGNGSDRSVPNRDRRAPDGRGR